ncbi:hypothetical protein K504DRAFT_67013 [Pleomassaria siparia CBS 279.74]|uniref:Uncharacterized protein n=1 Tax=Pleomassaria siparia CBS 279.74 TaxID=1314801 RepID=A0A6G1K2R7_9PLEO|nr:hypothetical protein K504DRAFT_67013 [Pleomassaria siparia CBS 279.74]
MGRWQMCTTVCLKTCRLRMGYWLGFVSCYGLIYYMCPGRESHRKRQRTWTWTCEGEREGGTRSASALLLTYNTTVQSTLIQSTLSGHIRGVWGWEVIYFLMTDGN